jgi:hypothetical protein
MSTLPDYFNPLVYEDFIPTTPPGSLPNYPDPGGGFTGYVPPVYNDGHRYPSLPLNALDFSYYKLGSGHSYVPADTDHDIRGTEVYRASITEVITIWDLSYRLRVLMDSTVGNFDFGEIGIFKADGTLLSLFVATELIHKRSNSSNLPNTAVIEATYLYRDNVATSSASWNVYGSGAQGPRGIDGLSASGFITPLSFSYGDASPAVALIVGQPSEILSVTLKIVSAFNGVGATLSLGTSADSGLIFSAAEVSPGTEAIFEFTPLLKCAAGTTLILSINPGAGATQGSGQVLMSLTPTT